MAIIKLGGSVITDKFKFGKARYDVINRLCRELSVIEEGAIVHGGGSFGHIKAVRYGFKEGCPNKHHFSEIHRDMIKLNEIILSALVSADIPVVSIPPHTFYPFGNLDSFEYYMKDGFIPVTYGDVFWREGKGWIISGDDLMLMLAQKIKPDVAVFVSDVDGIYRDINKKEVLDSITPKIAENLEIEDVKDATGGLRKKLDTMFRIASMGIKTYMINGLVENNLKNALLGKDFVGTEVRV